MKRAVVLSAILAAAVPALAQDYPTLLSEDGIGNITIGMDVERMEVLLHDKTGYNRYENHGCSTITTKSLAPTGISFMIENKLLTRVNVDYYAKDPRPLAIKTAEGIGLGSREEDVVKAYGDRAKVKPNPQDPTWHTIAVEERDRSKGIVFETDGKTVKSMRAGRNPAISYPLGCS